MKDILLEEEQTRSGINETLLTDDGKTRLTNSKPFTHVYYRETEVIKVHCEQKHSYDDGQDELYQHQLKERNLGFSHPAKTWFLTKADGEGDNYYIANRCPEMKTLAEMLPRLKPLAQLDFIARLLRYQFQAISAGLSLDLDLRNFAVTDNARLYYIDDDIYRWNDNAMLSDFLAGLIRSQDWLNEKLCRAIGKVVFKLIKEYQINSIDRDGIIQSLLDAYIAQEKYPLRNAIILGMGGVGNNADLN